jgi:hypothetical protein
MTRQVVAYFARQLMLLGVAAILLNCGGHVMSDARAQDDGFLRVTITEDRTIRDVAEQYLGDSDLWPEILRASGLDSVVDLVPGQELLVPVDLITAADRALRVALVKIQDANEAGAQLFAPDLIADAIGYRDEALVQRGEGLWDETIEFANQSGVTAVEAQQVSEANRDQAAEARLSDRQGRVEGQRPRELVWGERDLNAILIEEERVRTLSRSTAQITFRDSSRLRLNANSQAVIQRMRVDPLSNREEARVSLVEGDFYALLGGTSDRQQFEVDIPDVDATIDSGNFWVSNREDGARFTNYDDAPVRVDAQGETVMLGRNEGTVVRPGESPEASFDVLTPPELVGPSDDIVLYTQNVELTWEQVAGAEGYWLEIAGDPGFSRMVHSRWGLLDARFDEEAFEPGQYYWRIAALDVSGLPGARSAIWRFDVRIDTEPPYLRIEYPRQGDILRDASIEMTGQSEVDAIVLVNGTAVEVDEAGRYSHPVSLNLGENEIHVAATDPAGNESEVWRIFSHLPDAAAEVRFDDHLPRLARNHFLTGNDVASLTGFTAENAQILVYTDARKQRASTYTNERGRFTLNIPMQADTENFEIHVIAPTGFESAADVQVSIDRSPPEVGLSEPLPRATPEELIHISGMLEAQAVLTLNGAPVSTTDGAYGFDVLLTSGANLLEFVATDAVGNVKLEQWVVRVDGDPPQFERHTLATTERNGAAVITISVFARDASGLAVVAPFVLRSGTTTFTGYLRYNRAMRGYQGAIEVPVDLAGAAELQQVVLQDHAGNSEVFEF